MEIASNVSWQTPNLMFGHYAAAYAIKNPGTACFMLSETFEFIEEMAQYARSLAMEVLVEIHAHYLRQIEIARLVDYVYDFALPP